MTNLAEHLENISHDKINYYLKNQKLTPRLLWDNVKDIIIPDEDAYIIRTYATGISNGTAAPCLAPRNYTEDMAISGRFNCSIK